jgi:hypothetical protein
MTFYKNTTRFGTGLPPPNGSINAVAMFCIDAQEPEYEGHLEDGTYPAS